MRLSITSPRVQPSPNDRRVGIRIRTFEACSGFTLLRPTGLLNRLKRPLSRGSSPAGHPTEPLVSYQINRQLSGWNLPPLVIRAFGAHGQSRRFGRWPMTSGLPPETDILRAGRHVSNVPRADSCTAVKNYILSITLSAQVSSVACTARPGALAALRLITSSNLVGYTFQNTFDHSEPHCGYF